MSHDHQHTAQNTRGLKTYKSYIIGYVVSMLLTLAAFGLTHVHMVDPRGPEHVYLLADASLFTVLIVLAVIQLYVQVTCFLRLNASKEGLWELMPFLFTLFVVLVLVAGSLWIMYHLNYNMMH